MDKSFVEFLYLYVKTGPIIGCEQPLQFSTNFASLLLPLIPPQLPAKGPSFVHKR